MAESFYNPGVSNQAGQILAQGISSAGDSIGKGIEAMVAKTKALKATRAMAVDGLGMDPDQVDGMSLPQLQGMMAGGALKRSNVGQDLMQQNERLKIAGQQLQNSAMQREAQWQETFRQIMSGGSTGGNGANGGGNAAPPPGFMGNPDAVTPASGGPPAGFMGTGMQPGASGPAPMPASVPAMMGSPNAGTGGPSAAFDPARMMNAAITAGAPPRDLMEMGKTVMDEQRALRNTQPQFITDPQTGQRFSYSPGGAYGGGRLEPLAGQASGPQPQYDEDGKILGYSIPSGNGKSVFKPTAAQPTGELKPVTVNGKTVQGFGMDEKGLVHDLRASTSKPDAGTDPVQAQALRTAQRTIVNLKAAKAAGMTRVKLDPNTGAVKDAGMFSRFGAGDPVDDLIKTQQGRLKDLQSDTSAGASEGGSLTPEKAAQFLQQAGGDKDKARQMAKDAGFTF